MDDRRVVGRRVCAMELNTEKEHDMTVLTYLSTIRTPQDPPHLYVGTRGDNMRDKVLRGRTPRGEAHCRATLSDEQVRELRLRHSHGEYPTAMAEDYGVSIYVARACVYRKTWRHIQ